MALGHRHRDRHARRYRLHRAAGARLPAHRHQPLDLQRRAVRRPRPARGLGGGPAALARLHGAHPVDRRRRDGGRPRAAHRAPGHRRHARPDVRRARRVYRRRGRLRLPAAAAHEQDPGHRHGGAAGRRRLRLLRGLHRRRPAGDRVPARLLLADLDPRRRRRRAERPGRLHHPARRLHPLHLPAPAQLPHGALGHRLRTALRPADPAALRHLHGARRPGRSRVRRSAGRGLTRLVPGSAARRRRGRFGRQRRADALLDGPRPRRDRPSPPPSCSSAPSSGTYSPR